MQNVGSILQALETKIVGLAKRRLRLARKGNKKLKRALHADRTKAIRNLLSRKLDPPDTLNEVVAATLALTGFQHVLRVGKMRGHSTLLSALVERWRPETHTFHLLVGEVMVTLEDVSYILGLPINGEAVTGRSDSSHQFLVENCIAYFGREPGPDDHVLGNVNIAWIRRCRDTTSLCKYGVLNLLKKLEPMCLILVW
ncbi:hypothetical protein Ahy_A03g016208 [Arachis hypogaea]|uniref:Aminotransferase-like plant mobile domain-containing protein n=1 Tax=Arachis hypogaea TaxID=3818 RepID=A0A445E2S0_ARAHY|nr:hypothetical protein Ahy_A03g016208 [Arachis hypogaea]